MGETELPTVEETSPQDTEPPIRPLHGPTTTHHQGQLHPNSQDDGTPPTLNDAHTLTVAQVAQELGVDIK